MLKLFKRKTDDPRSKLQEVLDQAELPTFPAVVVSVLDKLRGDAVPLGEVADLLATDPGLSVRLLGTVNAAAFSLRHKVKNIHHAVSLLGTGPLESMLISIGVHGALPAAPARGFDSNRFWTTAARRAVTAKALAERIDPSASSESYTASLLQDMALPVLSHQKGDVYGEVLEQWHGGAGELTALEAAKFGWDHACVGKWMCEAWGFPEKLAEAIGAHHEAPSGASLPAVNLVAALREVDESPGIERLVELARDDFDIPPDETIAVIESSAEDALEISRMFA